MGAATSRTWLAAAMVTLLLATPIDANANGPGSDSTAGTRLTPAQAIRIANLAAEKKGYRLADYKAPRAHYEFSRKDQAWTVFFDGKVPKPGNHFLVWIEDRTGVATVMPGQ